MTPDEEYASAEAATQLGHAMMIVQRWMPDSADRVDILRRLGLRVAAVRRQDAPGVCRRCRTPFVWSAHEQAFYRARGLDSPTHCQACRAQRKAERLAAGRTSMMPQEGRP